MCCSGQQEDAPHHDQIETWADRLAFYTQAKEAGKHILPKDTKEALQHKIDPNIGERERKTVQALLYTSGGKKPDNFIYTVILLKSNFFLS